MMRMRRPVWLAGVLLCVTVTASGCDESLSSLAGPTPDLEPTFSSIQRLIFEAPDSSGRAACTSCHNPQGQQFTARLNLVGAGAHAALVGVASGQKPGATRVVAGDPDNSYLVHKLEGRSDIVGQRMPRTSGPFLTAGQMAIIRRWIARGAPND
jgi:hypothetical protein